jgi:hypothetical protein
MKLLSIKIAASALLALSSAFLIPNGTANGLYVHTRDKDGSHTHTLLSRALENGLVRRIAPSAKFRNKARGLWSEQIVCGNGKGEQYELESSDVHGGIEQFHKGCNSTLNLGNEPNDFYIVYGSAVFFMCNWAQHGQWCKNDEFDSVLQMVADKCGDHSGLNTGESFFSFE